MARVDKALRAEWQRGYYRRNQDKIKAQIKDWRKSNPDKTKATRKRYRNRAAATNPAAWKKATRDKNLRTKYGIGAADYDSRLAAQGGRCAMCGSPEPGNIWGVFVVDHDHVTGAVRALLCSGCNGSLGHYEKIRLLAEAYLRRFNAD